jgi:hypothetical protein
LRKTPFFRRKLAKIAENCDHNIDPWILVLGHIADCDERRGRVSDELVLVGATRQHKIQDLDLSGMGIEI